MLGGLHGAERVPSLACGLQVRDGDGVTPLEAALETGHVECALLLARAGARLTDHAEALFERGDLPLEPRTATELLSRLRRVASMALRTCHLSVSARMLCEQQIPSVACPPPVAPSLHLIRISSASRLFLACISSDLPS